MTPRIIGPVELKARTSSAALAAMDAGELTDRYIVPAERRIELELALDLETSYSPPPDAARDIPSYLRGLFDTYPDEEDKYVEDYKLAVVLLVERMALNPNDYASQSVGGASAQYGPRFPGEIYTVMSRWIPRGKTAITGPLVR